MRFGSVLLAMFLVTATLAAQYQDYQYTTPYYPGQVFPSPYYPGSYYPGYGYYPGSYYPGTAPVYMQQQIFPDQNTNATANNIINDLEAQVERLQGEVERLQNELTSVVTVSPPAPPPPQAQNAVPEAPATPVTVVFDNGARVEGTGYAIAGNMIWILGPTGARRFALSDLNLEATQRENLSRGVGFQTIPTE